MHWVFIAVLSLVVASMGYSSLWCTGFSLWWLPLLWSTGSRHEALSAAACGLCDYGVRPQDAWASVAAAQ